MRILLDTNIVLDVLLDRMPFVSESSRVWEACEGIHVMGYLPASVMTDIFYIAHRMTNLATARIAVGLCLATFHILAVDRQTLEFAMTFASADFEDNLQIATADRAHLDAIVTRNRKDFQSSPIPILTPAEFLTHL